MRTLRVARGEQQAWKIVGGRAAVDLHQGTFAVAFTVGTRFERSRSEHGSAGGRKPSSPKTQERNDVGLQDARVRGGDGQWLAAPTEKPGVPGYGPGGVTNGNLAQLLFGDLYPTGSLPPEGHSPRDDTSGSRALERCVGVVYPPLREGEILNFERQLPDGQFEPLASRCELCDRSARPGGRQKVDRCETGSARLHARSAFAPGCPCGSFCVVRQRTARAAERDGKSPQLSPIMIGTPAGHKPSALDLAAKGRRNRPLRRSSRSLSPPEETAQHPARSSPIVD